MIKKLLFIALAFLFVYRIAEATNIPTGVDPKHDRVVWTESVCASADIISSYIVQWDFDTSNPDGSWYDDMTNYVKTADAADDVWTAGVVPYGANIASGDVGQIIIRGPAIVYDGGNTVTANTFVSTASTGKANDEACNATDETMLGIAIQNEHSVLGTEFSIIYVYPTPYENGS